MYAAVFLCAKRLHRPGGHDLHIVRGAFVGLRVGDAEGSELKPVCGALLDLVTGHEVALIVGAVLVENIGWTFELQEVK